MFYSPLTGGFYTQEIHGENIPVDAVQITKEHHKELLEGQSQGRIISANDQGFPELIDYVISIEARKAQKWEEIKRERDRRMNVGGYLVDGHWFHSDSTSRIQQLGLVAFGNNLPAGLKWKVLSNGLVEMTPALAQAILATAAGNDNAIFVAALNHKLAMESSNTPETYDFSGNWPTMYEDTL